MIFWFPVLEENKGHGVLRSTGPGILTDAIKRAGETGGPKSPEFEILPCENFQRLPFGEYRGSEFVNVLGREVLPRLYPMKYCGDYKKKDDCHFGKHHGSASWTVEALV